MHWDPAIGLPLLLLSLVVLAAVYLLGRTRGPSVARSDGGRGESQRIEPSLGAAAEPAAGTADGPPTVRRDAAADPLPAPGHDVRTAGAASRQDPPGRRQEVNIERIVTLFVAARDGQMFRGADLVVAAEKVGLEFGDMGIFHRLDERSASRGPVFSVANMVKPGSFDLARIDALNTPGLGFFMTLPGPLPALDAWDTMLPAAQRMAELLGGVVLDAERNPLSRQGSQLVRDDLRGWDRRHEGEPVTLRGR